LRPEQQALAARVEAVLTQRGADGGFRYSKEECRSFVVACVLELDLPLEGELQGVFVRFLHQIGVPATATDDEVVAAVRRYFQEHPLAPALLGEMQAIVLSQGLVVRDEFAIANAAKAAVAKVAASGQLDALRAPSQSGAKSAAPRPRRGLK
jgi:hypothetical protein